MASPLQFGETKGMALIPCSRRGTWLLTLVVVAAVSAGVCWALRTSTDNVAPTGLTNINAGPLLLELTAESKQSRDDLQVSLRVTNVGSEALAWDEYWAVFLSWEVRDEKNSMMRPEKVDLPLPALVNNERYIEIKPGESRSKTFRLSQDFLRYNLMDSVHGPVIAEELHSRFSLDPAIQYARVRAAYKSEKGFHGPYGRRFPFEPSHVGMWDGECRSNEVTILLK